MVFCGCKLPTDPSVICNLYWLLQKRGKYKIHKSTNNKKYPNDNFCHSHTTPISHTSHNEVITFINRLLEHEFVIIVFPLVVSIVVLLFRNKFINLSHKSQLQKFIQAETSYIRCFQNNNNMENKYDLLEKRHEKEKEICLEQGMWHVI